MPKGFSTLIPRLILQKELPGIPRRKGRQEGERERQIKKHRERITERELQRWRRRQAEKEGGGRGLCLKMKALSLNSPSASNVLSAFKQITWLCLNLFSHMYNGDKGSRPHTVGLRWWVWAILKLQRVMTPTPKGQHTILNSMLPVLSLNSLCSSYDHRQIFLNYSRSHA